MSLTLLVFAVVVLLVVRLLSQIRRPNNYPPGPAWLPFVGNLLYLRRLMKFKIYQHAVFEELAQKYQTSVLGLKLGGHLTIIVSGIQTIRDVLTREEFEGRPDNFFLRLRTMGTRKGVTSTDGKLWHEQRAFVVRHLRRLGYGKESMENALLNELSDLRQRLSHENSLDSCDLGPALATAVLNVLWILVAGARICHSSIYLNNMLQLLEKRARLFDVSGGTLNHLPWLRFIAPNLTGYNLILEINMQLKTLFQEIIKKHEETLDHKETRDLIDAFLHQRNSETSNGHVTSFTEDQLIMVCLDLFIAGAQTTSSTLKFAFLLMVLYPDIQNRVRNEIWSTVGRERPPTLSDRPKLPYVEAVLMEVQRLCHVVPIMGPRRVLKDTTINGYDIPKNTVVLINTHTVHMDTDHWGDPHVFRPERFLNEGGSLKSDDWYFPFGLGRRRCLGDALARSCIFLFYTGVLQYFQISADDKKPHPSIQPLPGITMAPQPYTVNLARLNGKF